MRSDLAFAVATLAVSIVYYWMAAGIQESRLADAIGPGGLPKTYAILLAGLSLVLIARSIGTPRSPTPDPRSPIPRVAGTLAIGIAYILLAPWLGYLVAIAGVILATTYYQGGSVNRRAAIVAVGGGIFFWLLFVVMMGIQQPQAW